MPHCQLVQFDALCMCGRVTPGGAAAAPAAQYRGRTGRVRAHWIACRWVLRVQLEAGKEKELGNKAFAAKDYETAIQHFTKCIALDPK